MNRHIQTRTTTRIYSHGTIKEMKRSLWQQCSNLLWNTGSSSSPLPFIKTTTTKKRDRKEGRQERGTEGESHNLELHRFSEDLNRHFSKVDIQQAKRNMKRCSTSLIITETQVKIARYPLAPVKVAIIKKSTDNKCRRGCGEKGILLHCWCECKLVQSLWKIILRLLNYQNRITVQSSNPTPGYISAKDEDFNLKRYSATVYNSQDMETA